MQRIEPPVATSVTVTSVPKDRKGLAHVPVRAPHHDASPLTASCTTGGGGTVVVVVVVVVVGGGGGGTAETWRTTAAGLATMAGAVVVVVVVVVVDVLVVVVGARSAARAMGTVQLEAMRATTPRATWREEAVAPAA